MFLSACLLVVLGLALCLIGLRRALDLFGLGAMETLMWLGLAEVPAPPAPRRRFSA